MLERVIFSKRVTLFRKWDIDYTKLTSKLVLVERYMRELCPAGKELFSFETIEETSRSFFLSAIILRIISKLILKKKKVNEEYTNVTLQE